MSFSFGAPKTDAAPTFGFGSPAGDAKAPMAAKPSLFGTPSGMGLKTTTSTPAFSLGGTSTPNFGSPANASASANTLNFSLGGAGAAPASGGFTLGSATATTTPTTKAPNFGATFSLGATTTPTMPAQSAGFNLGGAPVNTAAPAPLTGFGLSATTAPTLTLGSATPASTGFSLGSTPAATTIGSLAPTTGFSLGGTPAKTPSTGLSFGTPVTAASTASNLNFTLGPPTATTAASTLGATITSALPSTGTLTFIQLEDAINKWTIDLEEQGKLFGNQAKQLNAWDRLLISNGEKVLSLNNGIERVKQQQQQLDQELDFVLAQQKELEDLITPLESELHDIPVTDLDRNHTYQLAENMDTQLKQMSEDLKEIIEQLNETNKTQEMSNPITQIGKILNAHMNSLQWVDRNTSKISTHLDQISKMHDLNRRNHEYNLQKTYDFS